MSNSFYGGRDGRPMIIKNNYKTVKEMLDDFAGAAGTTDKGVNFGDYVIIISENKNNPENGRLFRRGKDFNNLSQEKREYWTLNENKNIYEKDNYPAYGAMYIGQIVGPSGNAPHLHLLSTKTDVNIQYADFDSKPGYDVKVSKEDSEASLPLGNLVPGKDGENFNDKITWRYCSVRDENQQDTDAYIGFEIPYTVIEFDADSKDPYYNRSNNTANFTNTNLVVRHDEDKNAEHPFYQKWQIYIPKGIHGQSIKNLRIVNEGTEEEPKQVLKYDYYDYDTIGNPEAEIITLGDYNIIQNINLSDTGYLDIDTTASIGEVHQQLQWVKDITFDENGTVIVHYIDGKTKNTYENLIDWIKSINIAQDGTVTVTSNNGTALLTDQSQLKWVNGVSLETDGTFKQTYSNGDELPQQETKIQWPTNIKVNSDGTITTEYNYGGSITQENPTMNWISSAELDTENTLKINYLNDKNVEQQNIIVPLKTVNSIRYDGIDGKFYVTYNTGQENSIGAIGSSTLDAVTASEENEDTNSLRIGGVWFVVQEMES